MGGFGYKTSVLAKLHFQRRGRGVVGRRAQLPASPDRFVVEAVAQCLQDSDRRVMAAAANALGLIGVVPVK